MIRRPAASSGGPYTTVMLPVDNGADVNAQGGNYDNALYAASSGGHEQIVRLLVDNGADVNAQGGNYAYKHYPYSSSSQDHNQSLRLHTHTAATTHPQDPAHQ